MLQPHKRANLPPAPTFRKILGPSFIILGLGLGSGELILWPNLTVNFGLGILWGAVLGITFQFFLNMEIERYALVTGESVFVGLSRKLSILPVWFIISTILPWMWPGIIGSSAVLLGKVIGVESVRVLPVALLLMVGAILTLGPVLYKTEEYVQKSLIIVTVPFLIGLVLYIARFSDWQALAIGIVGMGDGYWFLPKALPIASFLAAFAYAGAGGNLNLAQSFYIKEKGYGMGKYSGRLTSILTGKQENIELEGATFETNQENLKNFRKWWKLVNIEHAIVFLLTGAVTIILLSFLAYLTVTETREGATLGFLFQEAETIGARTLPILSVIFLIFGSLMLFTTQLGVLDTTSRILTENLCLTSKKYFPTSKIRQIFFFFLWFQILLGVIIFLLGVAQPFTLVLIGAVLNAFAMFVYTGLILWLNLTSLEKSLRPSFVRVFIMGGIFLFFGGFSFFTLLEQF